MCNVKPSGTYYGSQKLALTTDQVSGPNDYQPGFTLDIGYKFASGASVAISWLYLTEHKTIASATSAPFALDIGQDGANSFLFSPVYGFPNDYTGNFCVNSRRQF